MLTHREKTLECDAGGRHTGPHPATEEPDAPPLNQVLVPWFALSQLPVDPGSHHCLCSLDVLSYHLWLLLEYNLLG